MRLIAAAITFGLLWAVGLGASAEEPRKGPPAPMLSEENQARWDKAKAILAKPDSIELYSLDPLPAKPDEKPKDKFHGWRVLGKTDVKDADPQKAVLDVAGKIKPGLGAKCFDPRHGIRASAGGKTVDLVICFECSWTYVFLDKEEDAVRLIIARDQQPALDKVLTDAKVPLPKQAKE